MATSVHVPINLLLAVDQRARTLKLSRNRLIVQALQREVTVGTEWSPGFFEQLAAPEPSLVAAADDMLLAIQTQRHTSPGAVLVTANLKHPLRIAGIRIEDWSLPLDTLKDRL
jgi:hypothetical protein